MSSFAKPLIERQTLFHRHRRGPWECQYRIPNLLVSKAGTLFAFPSEKLNSISDDAKSNFVLRRSRDGGVTWQEPEVLGSDEHHPRVSFGFNAGVADRQTGRVFVFYSVRVVISSGDIGGEWPEKWQSEHPEQAAALRQQLAPHVETGRYLVWTDDEGENWSAPQPVGDALHVVNPVTGEKRPFGPQWVGTQLRYGPQKGRLVIPGRGSSKGAPFDLYAYAHNYVIYSDDHGQTWCPGGLTQTGTGEACLVEETDGTLYVNSRNESLRSRGYRAWDCSHDGGETFALSGYDVQLPDPHCQASMARYSGPPRDRSRVLFCNPAVHSDTPSHYDVDGRRELTVRLSYDECRTWPVGRVVHPGGAGYSALAVADDGSILCLYETLEDVEGKRDYTGDLVLARFNLAWLTRGAPEPER